VGGGFFSDCVGAPMAAGVLDDAEDVGIAPNTNGGGSWGSLVTTGGRSDELRPKVKPLPAPNCGFGTCNKGELTRGV
jgi:hypothetical protein